MTVPDWLGPLFSALQGKDEILHKGLPKSVLSGWLRKGAMGPLHLFLLLLITGGTCPLQCFLEQMAGWGWGWGCYGRVL